VTSVMRVESRLMKSRVLRIQTRSPRHDFEIYGCTGLLGDLCAIAGSRVLAEESRAWRGTRDCLSESAIWNGVAVPLGDLEARCQMSERSEYHQVIKFTPRNASAAPRPSPLPNFLIPDSPSSPSPPFLCWIALALVEQVL